MKKIRKLLSNTWVISIFSPIITTIIILAFTAFVKEINFFEAFQLLLSWILKIITFRIPLYVIALAIILFVLAIYLYIKIEEIKDSNLPNWLDYTKEQYKNWIFKWEYRPGNNNKYEIKDLRPICQCECELSMKDKHGDKRYSEGILLCPSCENIYPILDREILDDFQKILIHSIKTENYPKNMSEENS